MIEPRSTIKSYLQTGDKPTQGQFENFIDSAIFNEDYATVSSLIYKNAAGAIANLAVAASRIIGRKASGEISALTASEVLTLLGVSAFIATLLDDADAATARTTLGLGTVAVENYTESKDQDWTTDGGTITWGGTTAPSGALNDQYHKVEIGDLVFFTARFEYAVAGTALTSLILGLPSGFPAPSSYTGWGNSEVAIPCEVTVATSVTGSPQQLRGWIEKDAGGTPRIIAAFGSGAYIIAIVKGFYVK